MSASADTVLDQSKLFFRQLPDLLDTLAGRWVIFRDGAVEADFATEQEAYAAAVSRHGLSGDYIVIRVEDSPPATITSARIFRTT